MISPTDNPTLREQLDAVRPDSNDLRDADLKEIARAIETSDEWREVFERQQAFDREMATHMQEVVVPDGLQERLLETLAAARSGGAVFLVPAESPRPVHRRRLLTWSATAAGLLLAVGLGWLYLHGSGSQITLAEARHTLLPTEEGQIDTSALAVFDDGFAFELPDNAWMNQTEMAAPLKGLNWTGDVRHDAAVYEFRVGGRVHGYLLVLPTSRLSDPPRETRLSPSAVDYQPVLNTAWTVRRAGLTYICFVDQGDLSTLHRLLYPHAA